MRYVQVDSQSDPTNGSVVPSTKGQFDMANMIAQDLIELGCEDVKVDEHAYCTAFYPASKGCESLPTLGFCTHLDSSFDCPASGVKPHIVHYEGGNLVAGVVDDKEIFTTPEECPYLNDFVGEDIICSNGSTLLSVDDKAGVAEIVSLIARIKDRPTISHPRLALCFVPDEEMGHGAKLLDLEEFGARWAYTIDSGCLGRFNYESFCASWATVKVHGVGVHTGSAKNIMKNAIAILAQFEMMLPQADRPEYTEGYEGFYHPTDIQGTALEAEAKYLVRDFDPINFKKREDYLYKVANMLNKRYGEGVVEVSIEEQYMNMADGFDGCPFLIDNALEAYRKLDIVPNVIPIRGGTDGSQLTLRGLPCPNLATGGTQAHSVREFIPVSALEKTVDMLEVLVGLFSHKQ